MTPGQYLTPEIATVLLCVWAPLMSVTALLPHDIEWLDDVSMGLTLASVVTAMLCAYSVVHLRSGYLMVPFLATAAADYLCTIFSVYVMWAYTDEVTTGLVVYSALNITWLAIMPVFYVKALGLFFRYGEAQRGLASLVSAMGYRRTKTLSINPPNKKKVNG